MRPRILLLIVELEVAVFPASDVLLLHLRRQRTPRVEVVDILLGEGVGTVDERRILRPDDRPLLCLCTDRIFRAVDEVDDRTSLKIVKTVRLIHHIHDGT